MQTKGLPIEKIKKETPKVYCSNCIHFSEFSKDPIVNVHGKLETRGSNECKVRVEFRDTWKSRESYYPDPQVKNKYNHCEDYSEMLMLPAPICEYCGSISLYVKSTNKGTLTICNYNMCIGYLHDATDRWMYNLELDRFVPVPEDLKIRKVGE